VVVTDTGRGRTERLKTGRAMVVDLREAVDGGPANYTLVDLDRLARPSASGAAGDDPGVLGRRAAGALARAARELLGLPVEPERQTSRVILYTAPWCGFCKKAALHLKQRGTAFVERDIDNDRMAAVELSRKLREAGLDQGGVPVLDIGGTIVIGFDKEQIDKLLDAL
jgi:glutaredoxin